MLGASYGFRARVTPRPGLLELEVGGSVDSRGATKVLALLRSEADNLGTRALDDRQLRPRAVGRRPRSEHPLRDPRRASPGHSPGSGWPVYPADTLERFPKDLAELTPAVVQAAAAQCRRTAVIGLLGEQATLDRLVPSG